MTEDKGAREEDGAEAKSRRDKVGDGFKQGLGVLSAFRDALEETIQEARDRGDLSSDRAKEVVKEALERAQAAAGGARDRLDFAHQADLDALRSTFDSIRSRVSDLEQSVFGASKRDAAKAADSSRTGSDDAETDPKP
ncbi:MAG: hypothetical protein O2958_08160 [Gemmatimonadetes bacterium]|nr:hypothetical protein [Gemmatimonadota bacterium]